jgi:hypothetical protein
VPRFRLELETQAADADKLIAQLLKVAGRRFGLRCTHASVVETSVPARAVRAAAELLLCYVDAADTGEREAVAAAVARLTPHGARPLAELAAEALAAARHDAGTPDDTGPQDASQAPQGAAR